MKRFAALTLTTALLGSGCIYDADDDEFDDGGDAFADTIVYWDFVRNAPAQARGEVLYDPYDVPTTLPSGICRESDVDTIELRTPVGENFFFDCVWDGVQGATLLAMPRGTHDYTLIGWRGDVAAYRSTVALTVDLPGEQHGIDVEAVSAPIDLFAWFRFGDGSDNQYGTPDDQYYATCGEAGCPDVFFDVYDSFGTLILRDAARCQAGTRADPLPVFVGDLDLDNYEVRMAGYNAADQLVFDSCTQAFDHFDTRGQTGDLGIPITLDKPVPSCQ
jgi:hypothetical protein